MIYLITKFDVSNKAKTALFTKTAFTFNILDLI
jgi:hypothetical protein